MSNTFMKCKILTDKASQLLSSISNINAESAKLPSVNLTSEECPRSSILSEENIVFKTHITWVIKTCELDEKQPGKYIESSHVEISSLDANYLWFRIYPKGKNSISPFLHYSVHFTHLPGDIFIVCEVALVNCLQNVFLKETFSGDASTVKENTINFLYFCERAKLRNLQMEGKLKEKLTVQCRIKLLSRNFTCVSEKFTHTAKMVSKVSSSNNDILKSGKYSDITLLVETNQVKAHKFILASESPALNILLKVNHREILELDEKYHFLQKLLKYMYTGQFRIFKFSDAVEFYIAGYKYEILNLKNLCTAYLIASLSEKSVSYIWDLSRNHQDEYLLNACIDFIKTHDQVNLEAFMKKYF